MNPALIMIDTTLVEVLRITATSLIGMFGISSGMTGWIYGEANPLERGILIVGGLLLINPSIVTDISGVGIIGAILMYQKLKYKNKNKTIAA